MKSRFFGVSLGSIIFILLLVVVLALVRPVYLRINKALLEFEEQLSEKLESETGLAFSYKSLSPSIFIGVNFRNISVYEIESEKKLVDIKRATLSYDILAFFSKNPAFAFKELSLNGVQIEYDAEKDGEFVERIKKILKKSKDKSVKDDALLLEKDSSLALGKKEIDIPINIVLKNLSIHYVDKVQDLLLTLKTLSLDDFNSKQGVEIDTSGKIFYKTSRFLTAGKWSSIACNFSLSGDFFRDLDGSSALVSISSAGGADYTISRLDMLFNYADDKVEVRTMRTALPYSIFARYDFKNKSLNFSSDFEWFNPLKLVSIRRKSPLIKKLDGTSISGSLSGKISENSLSYNSNIFVNLSENIFGESVRLGLKCEGDDKNVKISRLSAKGPFVDAYYSGTFNIKKLQPSGIFNLDHLTLNNGGIISTEAEITPYRNGFMFYAPQLYLGEKSFAGLEFIALPGSKSFDFQFDILDFSHVDYEEMGRIQIDGSFLTEKQKFLQTSITVSNIFADSIAETIAFFMPADKQEFLRRMADSLKPYIFTTEIYLSSDFENFTMNAQNVFVANTQKERELLVFTLDGSKETLQLSSFDLIFGNNNAHAETTIEFADKFNEFSFVSDLTLNSVPYHFFGNFTPGWIAISGDYDFDAIVSIDEQVGATLQFNQLPFAFGRYVFAATTSSILHWTNESGFEIDIVTLELNEPSANLHFNPHLELSGTANKYGFVLDKFSYTDNSSTLDGNGSLVLNFNDYIFDSARVVLNAESPFSSERINVLADLTNPEQLPFSTDALKNDFYISAEASLSSFPSSRILDMQNPENTLSADFMASGTISNPFVSVILHESSLLIYGYPLIADGFFTLDDTGAHIDSLNVDWSLLKISNCTASFKPSSFSGSAAFDFNLELMEKNLSAPVEISIDGASDGKPGIPDFISLSLSSNKVSGNLIKSDFPLNLIAVRTPDRIDITSGLSDGFQASYDTSGMISVKTGNKSPVKFDLSGTILKNNLDLNITGISANMGYICSEIEIPFVSFDSGILNGALKITGPTTDPEYTGAFSVTRPHFIIPLISKEYLYSDKVIMTVGQGEAVVAPTRASLGKGIGIIEYRMEFSRWLPNYLELKIDIDDDHKVPLDLTFPFIHAKGKASGNLTLAYSIPNDLSVSGFVVADDTDVEVVATPLQQQFSLENFNISNFTSAVAAEEDSDFNVNVDFDIIVGQRVQLLFNPFLRGVVTPGTPLYIYMDTYSGDFEFKSDITLRGGELTWLNRNFHMKEGRIVFNENQDSIDPKVTVRAETKARDSNGSLVTITLSANNQPVSSFNPVFSATPAKSEREIMILLGQIISADSSGGGELAGAGADAFLQSTVLRRVENTLRELLNFDIVSIRTNVVQNSLKYSMDENSSNKQMTVGNFIDNSTVYMGKYFGSSIYVDSLLQWTYDENKGDNGNSVDSIVFQPEIGFEMASPFVNIRLGVAPDIDSLQKGLLDTWVPSTSMTLSWKFAF